MGICLSFSPLLGNKYKSIAYCYLHRGSIGISISIDIYQLINLSTPFPTINQSSQNQSLLFPLCSGALCPPFPFISFSIFPRKSDPRPPAFDPSEGISKDRFSGLRMGRRDVLFFVNIIVWMVIYFKY